MVKIPFKKAERVSSTIENRLKEQLYFTTSLKINGYPTSVIRRVSRSCQKEREDVQKDTQKEPHKSEAIKRILTPLIIRIAF